MYENFSAPSIELLDYIFNMLQKIVSQLAILGKNISQEDLNLKFLRSLPSKWNTHVVVWRNKSDLDTMSIDDLYNNFKIVKQEVKRTVTSRSNSSSQNMAFLSSPRSTNEVNTANIQVSTANSPVSTADYPDSTANLSDATVYAFLVNQSNGSQLVHEYLEQIHEDDLEEMDLKWQLALLSMRARRYFQRIGKKITINVSDTSGYDKSKVECFNFHKMRHFTRECRGPRNQDNRKRNQDNSRRIVNVKETSSKAMVAIDRAGFDLSFMADDEVPTNIALMTFLDSEVYNDKTCTNTCLKNFETLKTQYDNLRVEFNKSEFNLATYKRGLASVEEQLVFYKKNKVMFCDQIAVLKRDTSFKDSEINALKSKIEKLKKEKESNQIKNNKFENASKSLDKLIGSLFAPPTIDLSNSGLEEFQKPEFEGYGPKDSKKTPNAPIGLTAITIKRKGWNMTPRAVLMKTGLKPLNTARHINTAHPKTIEKVYTAKLKAVNIARPTLAVVNAIRENQVHPQKEDQGYVDSGCSRHMTGNMSYLTDFKEFDERYVTFGGGARGGRITGKGSLKTGKLDFEDCRELIHGVVVSKFPIVSWGGVGGLDGAGRWGLVVRVGWWVADGLMYYMVDLGSSGREWRWDIGVLDGWQFCWVGPSDIPGCQDYIVMPLWKDGSMFDSSSKNSSDDEPQPSSNAENKDDRGVSKASGFSDQEQPESSTLNINTTGPSINSASANLKTGSLNINTVSPTVMTTRSNRSQNVSDMFSLGGSATLEATHADLFGDETEMDMSNLTTSYQVPTTPNTRIYKDLSLDYVIGDIQSSVQTRGMTKNKNEYGFISAVYEGKTHEDLHTCLFACFLSQEEPKRIAKALSKRAIGKKWIFRNKKDEIGIVTRNKARLVTQGYTQEEGIYYDEVFASVTRIEAIRLFLAYASFMGFMVYQMDVKSAFLYGTIEEEVYVCQPPRLEDLDYPYKVYKVVKTLYGLHQAPRAWYRTLAKYLLDNGFQRGKIDQTLFIKKQKGDILCVQVYVDDIIFGSINKELCTEFEKLMHDKFQISFIRELDFFLGLQVKQREDRIFISQDKYVAEILRKFGFIDVRTACTPMDTEKPLLKDSDGDDVDVHLYKSMIGSLMNLISSRPNIMFVAKHIEYLIPQSSGPSEKVGDEAVHKELGDKMERAATTASSLEAEQKLSDGYTPTKYVKIFEQLALIGSQTRVKDQQSKSDSQHTTTKCPSTPDTLTLPSSMQTTHVAEEAATLSYDSPLLRVYSLGSDEGSMTLYELMVLCTILSKKVECLEYDLKQTKLTYGAAFTKLIMKVKMLEKEVKLNKARRRAKIVVSDDEDAKKDTSKQGWSMIEDIDQDAGVSLLGVFSAAKILADVARVHTYSSRRRIVSTGSGGISTAEDFVSTDGASMLVSTAAMDQGSIPSPIASKNKGKAIMTEFEPKQATTKLKQRQEIAGYEAAIRLQEQLDEKESQRIARDAEVAQRLQEEIDASKRQRMAQVHQVAQGFTDAEWDDILARVAADEDLKFFAQQRAEAKRNKPMTPAQQKAYMSTYIKNQEGGYSIKQLKSLSFEQRLKRACQKVFEETAKRQNIEEASGSGEEQSSEKEKELSKEELQKLMMIVPVEEVYSGERFGSTEPTDDKERALWVELERLFEPNTDDLLELQRYMHDPLTWRLYDTCGVHHVSTEVGLDIFMLVEKDYPMIRGLLTLMLVNKLQVDQHSEMADELLGKIFILSNRPRH
ncbi:putative ribonuclease H-like domain-containing protein [Tanacetum coccineum]